MDENNTAWHAGNWDANISSIGIEHTNSGGAPAWSVAQATIDASARLCADIAKRHGLGQLVPMKNLFPHSHFSATACPGILKDKLQEIANKANAINNGTNQPTSPPQSSNLYRVSKSWVDANSQIGAFKDLANAKKLADLRKGYSVFDDKGNRVHGSAAVSPIPPANKTLTVQINGLNIRNRPSLSGAVVGQYNRGATWTLPKDEKFIIADGWVWARAPKGYCAIGRNTGKPEKGDYIFIT